MESIQALRELRSARALQAKHLLDEHTGDKWNKSVGEKVDALYEEIEDIDSRTKRIQKMLDLSAEREFNDAVKDAEASRAKKSPQKAVYDKWLRGGNEMLSAEEINTIKNTMSTTTGSQGGYTVPTEVAKSVADALKQYGGMRQVAEVFQTSGGADIPFPTSDGTSEVGELIAQNTSANSSDPSFGVTTLSTYKFGSKIITVPIELLQDTAIDMEGFINKRIRDRLGRVTNQYFTTGTGTSQPNGVVTAASSGKVGTTGQTATVIYDDLVDLYHSVDPAYRQAEGKVGFMMNDSSVKVIRKLKDTTGRPIWTPGYEAGIGGGVPDTLLGEQVFVNQDMASMAANAKSILYGNYSFYKIRDVMEVLLFRFTDSAYASKGQVGFLAWMRSGGTLTDVGGAVKYYANSAT